MNWLIAPNWHSMLVPDVSLLEIFIRGTMVYLGTFVILRVVLKREASGMGTTDLIVIVFIADAAQNAMAGDYTSVPDGLFLIATLVFWAWLLDFIAYHVPTFEHWLKPAPLPLIREGQLLRQNMHREYVTKDELLGQLREQGVERVEDVRIAFMESNGRISVVMYEKPGQPTGEDPQTSTLTSPSRQT